MTKVETLRGRVYNGDCFEAFKDVKDSSVDLILCDLPYGMTKNKWDTTLDNDLLWEEYRRVLKPNGCILLFGMELFAAKLKLTIPEYRYTIYWEKDRSTGFLNANKRPLVAIEEVLVCYKNQPVYNPQKVVGKALHSRGTKVFKEGGTNNGYSTYTQMKPKNEEVDGGVLKHPTNSIKFAKPHPPIHPTQKPIEICEWLIKTYSDENMLVLDNTCGSGTTLLASSKLDRYYIGMELNKEYANMTLFRLWLYENYNEVIYQKNQYMRAYTQYGKEFEKSSYYIVKE